MGLSVSEGNVDAAERCKCERERNDKGGAFGAFECCFHT